MIGAASAHAGEVQWLVTDKDGKPVPDVAVPVESSSKAAAVPAPAPVVINQEGSRRECAGQGHRAARFHAAPQTRLSAGDIT